MGHDALRGYRRCGSTPRPERSNIASPISRDRSRSPSATVPSGRRGGRRPAAVSLGRRGEPDRPRYQRGHDEDPARPSVGVLPHCGGRRVRVDGGPDEGCRLQDRSESARSSDTERTGPGASIGSFSDGVVWVGNSDVGTVVGIDALTGARPTFPFEHPDPRCRSRAPASLLVTLGPGPIIRGSHRRAPRGRWRASSFRPARLGIPDPAILEARLGFWLEFATCANLLNYPDVSVSGGFEPSTRGRRDSLPEISPDGRTYTFTVQRRLPVLSAVQ